MTGWLSALFGFGAAQAAVLGSGVLELGPRKGNLGTTTNLGIIKKQSQLWRILDKMVTCNSVSILFEKMGRKQVDGLKK